MRKIGFLVGLSTCVYSLTLTKIPPMPDIDQIQTDEEWAAMMEEYEAVQALRGAILRGEITLADATVEGAIPVAGAIPLAPAVPLAPVAAVAPAVPVAAVAAAPVAYAPAAVAAAPVAYAPAAVAAAPVAYAPAAVAAAPVAYAPAAIPVAPVAVGIPAVPAVAAAVPGAVAGVDAREAAVGNKVDAMMNASSDEEWNKMMDAYNKALAANPV